MMPPNYLQPTKQKDDQENHQTSSGGGRKTAASRPQEQAVKCPRCDSPNTKFCYYNNYSLTQPRHFCKTCRRYWTKGGALRHVPIGGGCRKNKKMKSSSTSRLSMSIDSKDSSGSSEIGGFKFFNGLLSPPTMDFNLGGLSFPRLNLNPSTSGLYNNQFSSFGDLSATSSAAVSVASPSCFSLEFDPSGAGGSSSSSLMGFNNYGITTSGLNNSAIQETAGCGGAGNSMNVHTNLASSIESLSSINQDLHWKLQQQRLAMLFGGGGGGETDPKDSSVSSSIVPIQNQQPQKPQPILFQNLEISKPEANCGGLGGGGGNNSRKGGASGGSGGDIATEWYFGNSFEQVTAATASRNGNSNANDNNTNKWNGVQTWSDLHHQYNALP